jgi:hypothetical protein
MKVAKKKKLVDGEGSTKDFSEQYGRLPKDAERENISKRISVVISREAKSAGIVSGHGRSNTVELFRRAVQWNGWD